MRVMLTSHILPGLVRAARLPHEKNSKLDNIGLVLQGCAVTE